MCIFKPGGADLRVKRDPVETEVSCSRTHRNQNNILQCDSLGNTRCRFEEDLAVISNISNANKMVRRPTNLSVNYFRGGKSPKCDKAIESIPVSLLYRVQIAHELILVLIINKNIINCR